MPTTFAWCFDHGTLHQFAADTEPWCTAAWVAFAVSTEEQALKAKAAAYGDAQFLDQLTYDQQLEVIEIRETWNARRCPNCPGYDTGSCGCSDDRGQDRDYGQI